MKLPARIQSHLWLILTLVITLLGTYWRFFHLGTDGLWLDETITVVDVRRGWIAALLEPNHPPLLHALSTVAIALFGESEWGVRIPAAFVGILGIPAIALLGKVMGHPRVGLWAALLLALSPFHLRYSQDARDYALLATVSTLTYVTLFLAVKRPRWYWWMAYGLTTAVNIYSHYGAFVVLVIEVLWLAGWAVQRLVQRDFRALLGPISSGITALVLYSVWIPRFLTSLTINSGDTATGAAGGRSPLETWLRESLWTFSASNQIFLVAFVILAVIGLLFCLWRRELGNLSFLVLGMVIPFVLIFTIDIARFALPKFVIYILPIYILTVAFGIDALLTLITRPLPKTTTAYPVLATGVTALLVITTFPLLQQEHEWVQEDWKGVAQTLVRESQPGDVFITTTLDSNFNRGGYSMPYYLDQYFEGHQFIQSSRLQLPEADSMKGNPGRVWVISFRKVNRVEFPAEVAENRPYEGMMNLAKSTMSGDALSQAIVFYEQMVAMAVDPAPRCFLEHDLATLYAVAQQYEQAQTLATSARTKCTDNDLKISTVYALQNRIHRGLIEEYTAQGDTQRAEEARIEAEAVALQGYRLGARDEETMAILQIVSLVEQFGAGMVQIEQGVATAPIEKRTFTIQGGSTDAIVTPPGASASFEVQIPNEPVFLDIRYALDPTSWQSGSDGSNFVIQLRTADGTITEIFRQTLGNSEAEHKWHSGEVGLDMYQGQTIRLTLFTEPGPTGDATDDLPGWAALRILRY